MSEDAFLAALKKNQQRKEDEEAARQSGDFSFGENFFDIKKMNLPSGQESVFRIIGKPYEIRTEPTDAKLVYHSRILNDKGRYSHIFWPTVLGDNGLPELDKNWELYQIFEKVTEGTWRQLSEEEQAARVDDRKSVKEYNHVSTQSLEWVTANKAQDQLYPPPFRPKKRVVFNAIDRHDSWCKEHKKSKVPFTGLGYGKSTDGAELEFINDIGIPFTAYNAIMENVVAFTHHWDIDIVLRRTKDKNNAYIVRDITEKKISDASKQLGTDEPLTEEEKQYEQWDVDYLFRPTSYSKLIRVLGGRIKLVDTELGTHFYNAIKEKAEKEKKEIREANQEPKKEETPVKEIPQVSSVEESSPKKEQLEEHGVKEVAEEPVKEEVVKEEKKEQPRERQREAATKGATMEFINALPNFDKLDEVDRQDIEAHIKGIENNVPVWTDQGLDITKCDNAECCWPGTEVRTDWPTSVLHCAVCGAEFKQA